MHKAFEVIEETALELNRREFWNTYFICPASHFCHLLDSSKFILSSLSYERGQKEREYDGIYISNLALNYHPDCSIEWCHRPLHVASKLNRPFKKHASPGLTGCIIVGES